MTDLDPELAATLRASADNRIRQQIADAALRRQAQADTRAEFAVRRDAGKRQLHQARQQLIRRHAAGQISRADLGAAPPEAPAAPGSAPSPPDSAPTTPECPR